MHKELQAESYMKIPMRKRNCSIFDENNKITNIKSIVNNSDNS